MSADEPVVRSLDGEFWHLESYLAGQHDAKLIDAATVGDIIAADIERYRDRYMNEAGATWAAAMTRAASIARGEVLIP